jgi:hypothetical protein
MTSRCGGRYTRLAGRRRLQSLLLCQGTRAARLDQAAEGTLYGVIRRQAIRDSDAWSNGYQKLAVTDALTMRGSPKVSKPL